MNEKLQIMQEQLENLTIHDKLTLIANLLVLEGFDEIGVSPADRQVDPHNIFRVIMRDRSNNGETIGNSMVLQGLTMLDWLAKTK